MFVLEYRQTSGKQRIPLHFFETTIRRIAKRMHISRPYEVSVALVGDAKMKRLNREYRGRNKTTDVLSFEEKEPFFSADSRSFFLGEVYISYPVAKKQAKRHGRELKKELETLFIHGMLHLLGFDHRNEREKRMMMSKEKALSTDGVSALETHEKRS